MSEEHLFNYLDNLRSEAISGTHFSEQAINNTRKTWKTLKTISEQHHIILIVPNACPGYDDNVLLSWDSHDFYVECEVFGDGRLEFFCRNKRDDSFKYIDTVIGQPIPDNVVDWLMHFSVKIEGVKNGS